MRRLLLAISTAFVAAAGLAAPAAAYHGEPPVHAYGAYGGARFDTRVEVQWGSSWWPATILQASGDQYLIRYDGYSSSWDEWVGPERIRSAAGVVDRRGESLVVSIQWGSAWYPGRVMKVEGGRYLVTYDGWSSTFDEWVGLDRLRFVDTPSRHTVYPAYPVRPVEEYRPYKPGRPGRPQHVRPGRQDWPTRGPSLR